MSPLRLWLFHHTHTHTLSLSPLHFSGVSVRHCVKATACCRCRRRLSPSPGCLMQIDRSIPNQGLPKGTRCRPVRPGLLSSRSLFFFFFAASECSDLCVFGAHRVTRRERGRWEEGRRGAAGGMAGVGGGRCLLGLGPPFPRAPTRPAQPGARSDISDGKVEIHVTSCTFWERAREPHKSRIESYFSFVAVASLRGTLKGNGRGPREGAGHSGATVRKRPLPRRYRQPTRAHARRRLRASAGSLYSDRGRARPTQRGRELAFSCACSHHHLPHGRVVSTAVLG